MTRVVLVDDEASIVASVKITLESEGFEVTTYANGQEALDGLLANPADIGVFDIKMPRMDGLELLRRLREKSQMPVLFLTSKDDEIDEVFGLRMGADDYITKPFSQRLLVERLRAVLRRTKARQSSAASPEAGTAVSHGRLSLNPEKHETLWDGKSINLTVTEFLILEALASRPGFVKNRDALMDAAYSDQVYVDDRTIDSHIKRIRRKFRVIDPQFDAIETLYGVGYKYKV